MHSPDMSRLVPTISRDMRNIFDTYFPFVWRYMAHRGVPHASLDDLVRSVFRIVREHPNRRDRSRPRSVLVCMSAHHVWREYKKHDTGVGGIELLLEGEGDSTTRTFGRANATQMLDATLKTLTVMQREVFLLCAGEKLSTREVADAQGVPQAMIDLRLRSAHQRLNTLIERLRAHPVWEGVKDVSASALLESAQMARTPSEGDRARIFAAMLASSMTSAARRISLLTDSQAAQRMLPVPPPPPPSHAAQAVATPPPATSSSPLKWVAIGLVALSAGLGSFVRHSPPSEATALVTEVVPVEVAPVEVAPRPETTVSAATALHDAAAAPDTEALPPAVEPEDPTEPPPQAKHRMKKSSHPHEPAAPLRLQSRGARQLFAAERALRSGEPRLAGP